MTKLRYGVRRIGDAWTVFDKWSEIKVTVATANPNTRDVARKTARNMSEIDAREREHGQAHVAA